MTIPTPEKVNSLATLKQWIKSWPIKQFPSDRALVEAKSGNWLTHQEYAIGTPFSVVDLSADKGVKGCKEYYPAECRLCEFAARSLYAFASEGGDVYWRIGPETDAAVTFDLENIRPDGPHIDFMTNQRGDKVNERGLAKFYMRFAFDNECFWGKSESVRKIDIFGAIHEGELFALIPPLT